MESSTGLSSACARSKVERAHGSQSMRCAWLGLGEKRMLVTKAACGILAGHCYGIRIFTLAHGESIFNCALEVGPL